MTVDAGKGKKRPSDSVSPATQRAHPGGPAPPASAPPRSRDRVPVPDVDPEFHEVAEHHAARLIAGLPGLGRKAASAVAGSSIQLGHVATIIGEAAAALQDLIGRQAVASQRSRGTSDGSSARMRSRSDRAVRSAKSSVAADLQAGRSRAILKPRLEREAVPSQPEREPIPSPAGPPPPSRRITSSPDHPSDKPSPKRPSTPLRPRDEDASSVTEIDIGAEESDDAASADGASACQGSAKPDREPGDNESVESVSPSSGPTRDDQQRVSDQDTQRRAAELAFPRTQH
jgi:hypothetical protein